MAAAWSRYAMAKGPSVTMAFHMAADDALTPFEAVNLFFTRAAEAINLSDDLWPVLKGCYRELTVSSGNASRASRLAVPTTRTPASSTEQQTRASRRPPIPPRMSPTIATR